MAYANHHQEDDSPIEIDRPKILSISTFFPPAAEQSETKVDSLLARMFRN